MGTEMWRVADISEKRKKETKSFVLHSIFRNFAQLVQTSEIIFEFTSYNTFCHMNCK